MFAALKSEIANRSSEVAELWREIDKLEREELATRVTNPTLRILKGLIFVHFYAVYEYAVTSSFAAAIRQFNAHGITYVAAKRELLALALHQEFQSIADLSERKCWPARIGLVARGEATDPVIISDALFPRDESHFRVAQLDTICATIGIPKSSLLPNMRVSGWIQEVVEHRNAIAHGRSTPSSIGGRYSGSDLDARRSQMDQLCNHIITTLESHSQVATNFHK